MKALSRVRLFATPWTAAYQAPLSMGFSRQEYWSGVPSPSPLRLDISYKKTVRNTNTWRLNNTFLNNQQVIEEIKREIKKFREINDNENTTTQNLWDTAKAVIKGKFIAM